MLESSGRASRGLDSFPTRATATRELTLTHLISTWTHLKSLDLLGITSSHWDSLELT